MFSLNISVYGLTAPIAGISGNYINPKRVILSGAILLALVTCGCSLANKLWHFYLLFGFHVPVGTAFSGWPSFSPALANWFFRKRGMAMGIGMVGLGLSFTAAILASYLI